MAAKSATVMSRIEPDLKKEAEDILHDLGIPVSVLINALYKQVVINHGVPFTITMPATPKSEAEMSRAEFNARLETGLAQAENGETVPIDDVFSEMRQRMKE